MNAAYEFVTGPLAWAAWGIFLLGSAWRLFSMYQLAKAKDASSIAFMDLGFSLRSIFNWLIPFNALGWKKSPAMTVGTFAFHACLIIAPIFLAAHVMLWDQFFGVSFITLPDNVADIMTLVVIGVCLYFAGRRIMQPEVRYITTGQDWLALAIVLLPFLTGFLAYHQAFNYDLMVILHVLAGEAMLAAIPFTRLSHMVFAVFTRAYMGSEFGAVRHARDW
ncbi:MAG TPA: nitrate reductase [Humidesulfovibrio sp.]|uniref:TmcC family electron transfer complex membrane anchor subunit n=1 Tax=Humidesulfovibrio sp. TaxID=2910988 RepID=UPI002BEC8986|nr:nitrate reductase [Humidesulfovibrio sp.]HWR04370.1 nitrate reductase [Humidesulfovibrio sp.]